MNSTALIEKARSTNPEKRNMVDRTLLALSDGEWHGGRELALTVSHRFGGYLHILKGRGVSWEKRLDPQRPKGEKWYQYRLTA